MLNPEVIHTTAVAQSLKDYLENSPNLIPIVLCDTNTVNLCFPVLQNSQLKTIVIEDGEVNKNLNTVELILGKLIDLKANRQTVLVNLGGGVLTDIGGFAASIYLRGIPFIHIPTTLLGMVDASIGGKTGIDFRSLKNQIGTFTHPETTLISSEFLSTLAPEHIKSAWAEIIKTAVISDEALFNAILDNTSLDHIIHLCSAAKQKIVEQDFNDKGIRQLLNFGHTIGHAYESMCLANDNEILHGFAVAKGMILELKIAKHLDVLMEAEMLKVIALIVSKTQVDEISDTEFANLLKFVHADKKNTSEKVTFSLPIAVGKGKQGIQISMEELKNWKNQGFI
jgi:3-dehydroquinate synthase